MTTMEKTSKSTRQQTDPLAARRQRRDRVSVALGKANMIFDYAGQRAQDSIAAALENPHFPAAAREWAHHVQQVLADQNFGVTVFTPTVPVDLIANTECSAIWNWAGKRERAAGIRTNMVRKLALAQNALNIGSVRHPEAACPPNPDAVVPPQDDDAADLMLEESHDENQAFSPDDDFRCGLTTVGHHSPKWPCRNLLGPDGVCQDHP